MSRKLLLTAVAVASLVVTEAAMAQDGSGGIWASRPRASRAAPEESVPASALPGLAPGLAVQRSDGKRVGTVAKVVTGPDGAIRKVVVMSPVGNLFKIAPTALTVSGNVVITAE